jgi:hypothetical protein
LIILFILAFFFFFFRTLIFESGLLASVSPPNVCHYSNPTTTSTTTLQFRSTVVLISSYQIAFFVKLHLSYFLHYHLYYTLLIGYHTTMVKLRIKQGKEAENEFLYETKLDVDVDDVIRYVFSQCIIDI